MTFRPEISLGLALLMIILASAPADAHAAPPAPEYYKRMLHDCNDDWGGHSAVNDGHDQIALDVTEKYVVSAGDDLVVFYGSFSAGFADQNSQGGPLKILLTAGNPGKTVKVQLQTNDNKVWMASSGAGLTEPAFLRQPKPVLTAAGTPDGDRFSLEIGLRYSQLGVQPGESLKLFNVLSLAKEKKTDYMPGGFFDPVTGVYTDRCPLNGTASEAYFVSSGYDLVGSAGIFFIAQLDMTKVVGEPNGNITRGLNITSLLKKTNQSTVVSVDLPSGWSVHVDPSDAFLLAPASTKPLRLHLLPGADAVSGIARVTIETELGGYRQSTIPLEVMAPPSPTNESAPPIETGAQKGDDVPAPGLAVVILAAIFLVAMRRRT